MIADPLRFCRTSSVILGVTGVGVTLLEGARLFGQFGASDDTAVGLEWAEFSLGEGPRAVVAMSGAPVLEPSMSSAQRRYPLFGPAARLLGANAIFTFPLRGDRSVIGTLSLYNDTPGDLSCDQLTGASMLADIAVTLILAAGGRGNASGIPYDLLHVGRDRDGVHRATGMVADQLNVSMPDALAALRAHAWATNQSLSEICTAVIERRLRLG